MYLYKIYGLGVESELRFPEIEEISSETADVSIFYGNIEEPKNYGESNYVIKSKGEPQSYDKYYMKNTGGFISKRGKKIKIDPEEGAEEKGFRFLVLGLAMGLILDQRGTVTFHASAVDLGEQSIAFAGPKGAGKSTAAAAFHASGYPVITDDLLPVSLGKEKVYSIRGFPHLKLTPTSGNLFEKKFSKISRIHPKSNKKLYSPADSPVKSEIPLETIYILDCEKKINKYKSNKLSGVESLKNVINILYSFKFKKSVKNEISKKCIELTNRVEVEIIKRPKPADGIEDIVEYITKSKI